MMKKKLSKILNTLNREQERGIRTLHQNVSRRSRAGTCRDVKELVPKSV